MALKAIREQLEHKDYLAIPVSAAILVLVVIPA
jgi:hypothetical protein